MTANKVRQDRQRAYVPWYTYTPTLVPLPLYPWYPMPTTYIHTCIDTFVLFIYLIVFVFVYLIVFVSLTLLFSLLSLSPYSWQGLPLGRGSRSYLSCVYQSFILFNYYPVVHRYSIVCMYVHVLYSVCVYIIYYVCIQQMCVCT